MNKWLTAVGYTAVGLFLAVTPIFLVETLMSTFSLLQYVGGGLLVALAIGTVGEFAPLIHGQRKRVVAIISFALGFLGLAGQFVIA
jgi:thiol:disulfide interchange protein